MNPRNVAVRTLELWSYAQLGAISVGLMIGGLLPGLHVKNPLYAAFGVLLTAILAVLSSIAVILTTRGDND